MVQIMINEYECDSKFKSVDAKEENSVVKNSGPQLMSQYKKPVIVWLRPQDKQNEKITRVTENERIIQRMELKSDGKVRIISNSNRETVRRSLQTDEQKEIKRVAAAEYRKFRRSLMTLEQRQAERAEAAERQRMLRARLTPQEKEAARIAAAINQRIRRSQFTPEQKQAERDAAAERQRMIRAQLTPEEKEAARNAAAESQRIRRSQLTSEQKQAQRIASAERQRIRRSQLTKDIERRKTATQNRVKMLRSNEEKSRLAITRYQTISSADKSQFANVSTKERFGNSACSTVEVHRTQPCHSVSSEILNVQNESNCMSNSSVIALQVECESDVSQIITIPQNSYLSINADGTLLLECESEPHAS